MLDKFKRALLWEYYFDKQWQHVTWGNALGEILAEIVPNGDFTRWDRTVSGSREHWRQSGKQLGNSPQVAVFHALEEILNLLYREYREKGNLEQSWRKAARFLWEASLVSDTSEGGFVSGNLMKGFWKTTADAVREERSQRDKQREELASIRIDYMDADRLWNKLLLGEIPVAAKSIWRAARPPRSTAHKIVERANVSLQEFVLWMVVFRDHGLMQEFAKPYSESEYMRAPILDSSRNSELSKVVKLLTD